MQNNKLSLEKYLSFDLEKAEDYQNLEVDLFENLKDQEDSFSENYTELSGQTQNLDNSSLNASQSDVNQNNDKVHDNGNSFLNTNINQVDDGIREDYSTVEKNEIHYLNFIRKSEIAVYQQNALRNHRYSDYQQEENLKTYTVVCIDDSRAVVNAIKMYLNDKIFSVIGINDPLKALMQIVRLKPDIILLDITMPTLDGYELCSLLRKHSLLKETPVIMVTGKKGIINRVKAKMVKASDYLTKPFQKKDLLKVIFKYIV
ncbi:response regulator [Plectonema cf. radiosum LEGE 06105]|uniref:Response regulator n=1 Tax=Plectonema cf. radiosum LEGE 06105 TaxID=945769 RepID=A0A8J7F6H6_9CYAN|nr:response regulator [Plectonema radiosum]MBE9212814.1 response regulator [Plectonema cf. radiosum LEGE 06105]